MTPARTTPGPITWCAIISATCLLLLLFQKVLWLVVPFLLALVLYYMLEPLARKMEISGFSTSFTATVLSGAFLLGFIGLLLLLYPIVLAELDSMQSTLMRYLSGGYSLIDSMLGSIEQKFSFARHAHISDSVRQHILTMQDRFAERHLASMVMTIAAWLPSLLLITIITFFLIKEGKHFRQFLGQAVPNAFFEKTLYLSHAINRVARLYFVGLIKLTLIDIFMMFIGLWVLGISSPLTLAIVVGLLGQIPYVGPLLGGVIVLLITGTDFPGDTSVAYSVIALFVVIRLLDDFVFLPAVVGKSLRIHPLLSILMLFVGGTIAGIAGLMLVLPLLGIVMLLGETLEIILTDQRLRARHAYASRLRGLAARADLTHQSPH
jgi:predicted PurR-regulated permease PerM